MLVNHSVNIVFRCHCNANQPMVLLVMKPLTSDGFTMRIIPLRSCSETIVVYSMHLYLCGIYLFIYYLSIYLFIYLFIYLHDHISLFIFQKMFSHWWREDFPHLFTTSQVAGDEKRWDPLGISVALGLSGMIYGCFLGELWFASSQS